MVRGDNDRLSGKRKVDRILMDLADGRPGLQIFDNCLNLIRTLPALPYSKERAEDVDSDAEDHAYDPLRYGLTRENDKAEVRLHPKKTNPWRKLDYGRREL